MPKVEIFIEFSFIGCFKDLFFVLSNYNYKLIIIIVYDPSYSIAVL